MDLQTYALYSIALNGVITLDFSSVAALILWKANRHWMHWFTGFVLLFIPTGGLWEFLLVSRVAYSLLSAVQEIIQPTHIPLWLREVNLPSREPQ